MNSEKSYIRKTQSTEHNQNTIVSDVFGKKPLLEKAKESSLNVDIQEKDIDFNEFLDLMKVSSHVNDMIAMDNASLKTRDSFGDQPLANFNFEEIVGNRLVNELLSCKKDGYFQAKKTEVLESENPSSSNASNDNNLSQRRSSAGLTIGSFSKRTTKKVEESTSRETNLHPKLYKKLDYIINEGMVDSVLSFICPVPVPATFPSHKKTRPKESTHTKPSVTHEDPVASTNAKSVEKDKKVNDKIEISAETLPRDSKKGGALLKSSLIKKEKKDPEVTIHVCDEVKNTTRDFVCSQRLLVNKMGYFANITAGQKLEEMDISVHCDIQIFDWLMKWIKISDLTESSNNSKSILDNVGAVPQLDTNNVIPILVSANFLQMEPLMQECLSFCHSRLTDVVRSPTNVTCLSDFIITRLAAMFTNLELDMVRDKKERLVPRLWAKLIQSLCEPEPEALRGHFYSLAGLFRCSKCGEYVTNTIKSYIKCVPSNMRLNRWGQLVNFHIRDNSWNMNAYIAQLFKDLKSWRHVYWKLWGHSHFLFCCVCETHFPVYQMTWCRYHPLSPNFLGPFKADCIAGPTGRFPCCGQQSYRFETLPGSNGCQFREHSVLIETDRERQILQIVQIVSDDFLLCEHPPRLLQEMVAKSEVKPFWSSLPLIQPRCRTGLLPNLNADDSATLGVHQTVSIFGSSSDTESTEIGDTKKNVGAVLSTDANRNVNHSSDGCESELSEFKTLPSKKQKARRRQMNNPGRFWCGELSARSNQDHQREYEERILKHVETLVNKKTGSEPSLTQNYIPNGGSYVRLENEWKDQLRSRGSSNPIFSNSITGFGRSKYK